MRGRVGSLLEVGTGFHPDLTGRENIFFNGSLLGIPVAEIRSRFNAIIEFSGIGEFIDVPVKRYSSGMYVRLAYSVAALLDSEIMILDEVLAVGDEHFRDKTQITSGRPPARERRSCSSATMESPSDKFVIAVSYLIAGGWCSRAPQRK